MPANDKPIIPRDVCYFLTFNVIDKIDVFVRPAYKQVIADALNHFIAAREVVVYAWCLMSNHIHLVVSAKNNDTSDILRDFKKFTSKQIIKAIETNQQESRRDWMLQIFKQQAEANSRNTNYQFWRQSLSRT